MQFRIGDRDPVTGLYNVIYPDGSQLLNGIKIFNAAHQTGDVVLATQRSDGMMILDSAKAADDASNRLVAVSLLGNDRGYLSGQVFNIPDEDLPRLSIDFAPASPTFLDRYTGQFTIRVSLDRIQSRDLKFQIDALGTAQINLDYSVSVNLSEDITIAAGQLYQDIGITPIYGEVDTNHSIAIALKPGRSYKITKSSVTMTLVPIRFTYRIHTRIAPPEQTFGPWTFIDPISSIILDSNGRAEYESAWLVQVQANGLFPQFNSFDFLPETHPIALSLDDPLVIGTGFVGVLYNYRQYSVASEPRYLDYRQSRILPPSLI